ncbi:MAG: hypothetical protein MUE76_05830 [Syntrophales bacterium]|nr:hypothetical protein [Syntrophales bacterium]
MNLVTGKNGTGTAGIVVIVVLALAVAACASGTILKWNQVDAAALMNSERGGKKMNTIRFETFGPDAEQIFGYFLYKDGIEVITGGGIPQANLGKLTLREVMDDHARVIRARCCGGRLSSGSRPATSTWRSTSGTSRQTRMQRWSCGLSTGTSGRRTAGICGATGPPGGGRVLRGSEGSEGTAASGH